MSRQDQYEITLMVDDRDCGVWDTKSGGGGDSEENKYREGGMGDQVSLGGPSTIENITLGRLFKGDRDSQLGKWLYSRRGKASAVVIRQKLDVDGHPFGEPWVWRGKLKMVTPGDVDSNSADPDTYEVEISTEGEVA